MLPGCSSYRYTKAMPPVSASLVFRERLPRFAILMIVAVAIRLLALLVVVPTSGGDGVYYLGVAQSGPDLFRPPLYSLFVMTTWPMTYIAQSILIIGTSLFAYGKTGSFWAGALIACCPFLIVYEYSVLAETLLISLLLCAWLLLDKGKAIWAGVCVGLAILTNDVFLLLPLFAIPFGVWLGNGRSFAIMALTAYLATLPWASYNLATHQRFTLSEGRLGLNLWIGTWERNGQWLDQGIHAQAIPQYAFRSQSEKRTLLKALHTGDDGAFKRVALDRIASDPAGTSLTWFKRYWRLWLGTRTDQAQLRLQTGSIEWALFKASAWGFNLLLLVGGLAALVATRGWMMGVPALYVAAIYLPFHNIETRYSLPALVFLLIPLGSAFSQLLSIRPRQALAGVSVP